MVSKRWTWPAALTVLFAGLTNAHAHVHYCFDGQEPPTAVHLVETAQHAPCHDAGDCDYVDVDVPSEAFAKAYGHDIPALAPLLAWSVGLDAPIGTTLIPGATVPPATDPPFYRPPPRAPPG